MNIYKKLFILLAFSIHSVHAEDSIVNTSSMSCKDIREIEKNVKKFRKDVSYKPLYKLKPLYELTPNQISDCDYLERKYVNFMFGGLKLSSNVGYTNEISRVSGVGVSLTERLESAKTVYGLSFGWEGKPIVRDAMFVVGKRKSMEFYRNDENKFVRWAFIDAFKLEAKITYGNTLLEEQGMNPRMTNEKTSYTVGIKYELPLDKAPFITKWEE